MDLPCLKCGEVGDVHLDLADGDTIRCRQCDGEFTAADVEAVLAAWGAILPWLKAHPARSAGSPAPEAADAA